MQKMEERIKQILRRENFSEYVRIRDLVNGVYLVNLLNEYVENGADNINEIERADEAMSLILDILEENEKLSDEEIMNRAIERYEECSRD